MSLQEILTEKIDSYGGIEKVTKELNICANNALPKDKFYIDNMIIYLNMLFIKLPEGQVERDSVTYKESTLETLTFLKGIKEFCPITLFLIDLIEYKIKYVFGNPIMKKIS